MSSVENDDANDNDGTFDPAPPRAGHLGESLRELSEILPPSRPLFWHRASDAAPDVDCGGGDDDDYESVPASAVWGMARGIASELRPLLTVGLAGNSDHRRGALPLVGVYAEPSVEYAAAVVATLWAGAAWVPLDPRWATERLTRVASHANLSAVVVVISSGKSAFSFALASSPDETAAFFRSAVHPERASLPARTMHFTAAGNLVTADSVSTGVPGWQSPVDHQQLHPWEPLRATPWDEASSSSKAAACYVMFTSGSTGAPKGVCGTHEGVDARVRWAAATPPMRMRGEDEKNDNEEVDRGCLKTSVGFVDSVAEIFCPLLQGAASVVVERRGGGAEDPARRLAAAVWAGRVTHLTGTPSTWATLVPVLRSIAAGSRRGLCLRTCTSSGEPLPTALLLDMLALEIHRRRPSSYPSTSTSTSLRRMRRNTPFCVFNLYGSTEMAGDATGLAFMTTSGGGVSAFWYHGVDEGEERGSGRGIGNGGLRVDHFDLAARHAPAGYAMPFAAVMLVTPKASHGASFGDGSVGKQSGAGDGGGGCGAWALVNEVNETGEVAVLGKGVAAGYLGGHVRAGAKASDDNARFTTMGALLGEVAAGPHASDRVYRTGDLGRWSSTGSLLLDGRNDDVVKVFGERVSLSEVEAAAMEVAVAAAARFWHATEMKAAAAAAAMGKQSAATTTTMTGGNISHGREDDEYADGDEFGGVMAVYVVIKRDDNEEEEEEDVLTAARKRVVESCRRRGLPRVSCPPEVAVEILEALPLTDSGKLDRAALPFPTRLAQSRKRKAAAAVATADTLTSCDVVEAMNVVLGSGSVEISSSDDFFQVGAASPDAVALAHRLGVPARLIFEHRTAAAIADATSSAVGKVEPSSLMLPPPPMPLPRTVDNGMMTTALPFPSPLIQTDRDEDKPGGASSSVTPGADGARLRRVWSAHLGRCVDARPLLFLFHDTHDRHSDAPAATSAAEDATWRVVIGSHSHEVRCLSADSGRLLWCTELPGRVEAGAVLADRRARTIAVPCLDGKVHFLRSTDGALTWSYDTGQEVKGELTVDDHRDDDDDVGESERRCGGCYLLWGQSHGGTAFAINEAERRAVWRMPTAGPGVAAPALWSLSPRADAGGHRRDGGEAGDAAEGGDGGSGGGGGYGQTVRGGGGGGGRTRRRMVFFATLAGVVIAVDAARAVKTYGRRMRGEEDEVNDDDEGKCSYRDDDSGSGVVWRSHLGAPVFSSPAVAEAARVLCVATVAGTCCGLCPDVGAVLWTVHVGSPVYAPLLALPPPRTRARSSSSNTVDLTGLTASGAGAEQMLVVGTAGSALVGLRVSRARGGAGTGKQSPAEGAEAWRWTGRGRIRAAPVVVPGGEEEGEGVTVTLAVAWDSGEVHVIDVPNTVPPGAGGTGKQSGEGAGGGVVRPVARGRLSAAVFSSPAPSSNSIGEGRRAVYVGCRDDFIHCLRIA